MCIKRIWTNDTLITTKQMTSNKFCNRLWALLLFFLHAWTVNVKDGLIICMSTRSFRIAHSQATECPEITARQKTHPRHLKTIKNQRAPPPGHPRPPRRLQGYPPIKHLITKWLKTLTFLCKLYKSTWWIIAMKSEALECDNAVDSESHHFNASMSPETKCE